jgi:DnaJ-class molecular chaperone
MFFGGNTPFGGMNDPFHGAKIHVFHQNSLSKPTPILKTINIQLKQVLQGDSIPLEIERWVIESGMKVFEKDVININIPQGVNDNEIIILREQGNILNENCKGDIKLIIKITNDTEFKRSGLDLIYEKNISLKESLCGFSFEIKYLNDKIYTLNNNKGNIIPPEYKKIYSNMGLSRGNNKGNLIIHFHILFPETISMEQIKQLEEIL